MSKRSKTEFSTPEAAAQAWNTTQSTLRRRAASGTLKRIEDPDNPNHHLYALPTSVPGSEPSGTTPRFARELKAQRYLITSAQNSTPVHKRFFESLKQAAAHLDAELVVIPLRYKNPTSLWTASQENEERWASELVPYLFNQRKFLNENLVLLGDVKAHPTAVTPLSGFEAMTGSESAIIGHTKVSLKVVPVAPGRFPKILATTGAVTVANYTDSKAGKLGEFHHSLGAVIVETNGRRFHLRQIGATKDGSFIDLDTTYSPEGVVKAPRALALVMGDTHVRFVDPDVVEATFGDGGIVEALDPETLVWHDVLDGYAVNPHHNNPFISIAKMKASYTSVQGEVEEAVRFLDNFTGQRKSVVVSSNHDNFLSRWVTSADWKSDPTNAQFYLETALMMVKTTEMTADGTAYSDPFREWAKRLSKNSKVRCLTKDESFTIAGIECGLHGNVGPNGSRGSIKNLARIGTKTIIGHSHTPGIFEGCYQTGTSTPLSLEYTEGPSSWLNTHVVVYANGKRSLITIIDGEWRVPSKRRRR